MLAAIAVVAAAVILLLVTAGEDRPDEARGDLTYMQGEVPRQSREAGALVASIADITAAAVTSDDESILFDATVAAPLKRSLKTSALEMRWDIRAGDGPTWTLTVAIDRDARTSLFSDAGYGAGTVDDTFPGALTIDGTKIEVRLDAAEIENFPEEFEWRLATTLRAFREEPDSPRVEDQYPDEGSEEFED